MLIPMVLIIGIWGGPRRVYASVKFFLYTMVGSLLMLLAVIACYGYSGMETFDIATLSKVLPAKVPLREQMWLFAAFAVAFAVKVPLFPFHTWLPDAHVEAPTAGSVILAGVLLKMGVYGFIRLAMPFFPDAAVAHAGLITALSVVSIVFGALMSMSQSDIKKLIAYSSVSHLGFCMLGLFSFTEAGIQGSVLQMVNHGLSTGALFLLVGVLYVRTHKRGVEDFGGLAKVTPLTAATFLIVTLASIGLPGLNGFVSEFLCLAGAFEANRWAAGISATAVILGAMYMLKLYRDVFWGPVTAGKLSKLEDLKKLEVVSLLPLVALIVVLGLWPKVVLHRTEAGAKALVETMKAHGKR
jgi:NADH-quinone oxidoreductase subunit M